jgi:hypothetical protein
MSGYLSTRNDEARAQLRAWLDAGELESLHDEIIWLGERSSGLHRPARRGHLGPRIVRVARCTTDLVYQAVGLSGWYSQTSKKRFRSIPLRCSARSMNWAVVTLP